MPHGGFFYVIKHVTNYVFNPKIFESLAPGLDYVMCDLFDEVKKSVVTSLSPRPIYLFIHLIIHLFDYLFIYKLSVPSKEGTALCY